MFIQKKNKKKIKAKRNGWAIDKEDYIYKSYFIMYKQYIQGGGEWR